MIETLDDRESYRRRARACWQKNASYWLSNPLRHVADVGEYIIDRVIAACSKSNSPRPTIVDMGFGSAWVYDALRTRRFSCNYVGLDSTEQFVCHSRNSYATDEFCRFELTDLEEPVGIDVRADVVLNAFTFFELAQLQQPMMNAYKLLRPGGSLLVSTIDSTYLILAVSNSWDGFRDNLARYEKLPGTKYAFQPIDLGDRASSTLEYPSVLYSRDDYITAASSVGFRLTSYKEHIFTAKPIPKIYVHLELLKGGESVPVPNR